MPILSQLFYSLSSDIHLYFIDIVTLYYLKQGKVT